MEEHQLKGMYPRVELTGEEEEEEGASGLISWKEVLAKVIIPTKIKVPEFSEPVKIPSQFDPRAFPLRYDNEFKILHYVDCMVKDAIYCMGCIGKLDTDLEISFYGVTPDLLIVHEGGKMIFIIEVKAPNRPGTDDDVFGSNFVGWETWMYLMAMKQAGVENPLGAICTFNQIQLVSLEPMKSHPFERARGKLNNTVTTPWAPEQPNDSKGQPNTDRKRQSASAISKRFDFEHPASSFDPEIAEGVNVFKAALRGSVVADTNHVFPMLLLGLTTAKIEADGQSGQTRTITKLNLGDDLGSRQFVFATETILGYARTPNNLRVTDKDPIAPCNKFYLLHTVGPGRYENVFLAVSTGGFRAAVKFYPFKPSRQATHEGGRCEANDSLIEAIRWTRDEELKRWEELYPERKARAIQLRGLPCLLMPYGTRIPAEKRKASLDAIKNEMARFLEFGYVYQRCGLRWCHVLCDRDGKIFLANLATLEKVTQEGDYSTVEEQINYMEDCMDLYCGDDDDDEDEDEAEKESGMNRSTSKQGSLQHQNKKKKNE